MGGGGWENNSNPTGKKQKRGRATLGRLGGGLGDEKMEMELDGFDTVWGLETKEEEKEG